MKKHLSILLTMLISCLLAQAPEIEWKKNYGGTAQDQAFSIQQTTDGGYITAGWTSSVNGNITNNHGESDFWVVKLKKTGALEWEKSLGGSQGENANTIKQTSDGGYIVVGWSESSDGDLTTNHGDFDLWIVKLDNLGNIQWQKSFGGSDWDEGRDVTQTSDGGYIVAGLTYSNDGDIVGHHGGSDFWILKLDSDGNLQWQRLLGGSYDEEANSIQQTLDGGYIVTGPSDSVNGDLTPSFEDGNYWVVKLNSAGNIEWQKTYGGDFWDESKSIQQTFDGGYIVAGISTSTNRQVVGNHGAADAWILKLSPTGGIQWKTCLGGSSYEDVGTIRTTNDGGYILGGSSYSNNGDVSGNHGSYDYWLVKLNSDGSIQWQKTFGGSDYDKGFSAQETSDNGFVIAGMTRSSDGDITGPKGGYDFFILKLKGHPSEVTTTANPEIAGTTSGGGVFNNGKIITVKAVANTKYIFESWMDGNTVVSTAKNYKFTVTKSVNLVAKFVKQTFNITTTPSPAAGGTTTGTGTYQIDQTITVKAIPATGYLFESWMQGTEVVSTDKNYSFTVTANRALKAKFVKKSFNIATSATPVAGGTTTGAGTYFYGQNLTVKAVASPGYVFESWMQGTEVVSTSKNYTFIVTANRTLKAKFAKLSYKIATIPTPIEGGKTFGDEYYLSGSLVTVTAEPATGYYFESWKVGSTVVSTNPTYSFIAESNRTLKAIFKPGYNSKINATPNFADAGLVSGSGYYGQGGAVSVIATVNPGYNFVGWMEDGKLISTDNDYSFEANGDRDLVAYYEKLSTNSTNPIQVYPNPFSDFVMIDAGNDTIKSIELYDLSGRLVYSKTVNQTLKFQLDTRQFVSGNYLLMIHTDKTSKSIKVYKK